MFYVKGEWNILTGDKGEMFLKACRQNITAWQTEELVFH